ncbi:hypothetical protein BGZ65_007111 [Modicella reniformis]|uniref:DUF7729 domain-containing protein n=1 Tax=Modicella reniformis TaxID=1440133 RepID=A0A9P6LTT5_9FUNG|nr:hypothetical protein BGZ65_007111 [Modicella reniformis]
MKLLSTVALIALGAGAFSSTAEAVLSAGCNTYITSLSQATNSLAKCRVYTALGFPGLTHTNDHDTDKLQKALTDYCATPACTKEQYAGVLKDLQTNCAADMVAENQDILGTTMTMWYLSPAQREAVCLKNPTTNTTCVVESIKDVIARGQFPNDNKNEDDLYGYIQYVSPLVSAKGNTTAFCSQCNQEVANIFSNHYIKNPSSFPLNFAQQLSSSKLNEDLQYQYKSACKVTLGTDQSAFKPTNPTNPNDNSGSKDGKNSGAQSLAFSFGGVAAAAVAVAVAMI